MYHDIERAKIYLINKMYFIAIQSTAQTPFAEWNLRSSELVQLRINDIIFECLELSKLFCDI